MTCPISEESLSKPIEGIKHINRQRNEYSMHIILHPKYPEPRQNYSRNMAKVVIQLGRWILEREVPACMPSPGGASYKFTDEKYHFDYGMIVYHEPNVLAQP